ncbi:MAG: ISAzo13 family transposase [Chloroflexota bacterium]|nr:ISAzo13 family transposase [Chloroflexota bacterium]
MAALLEIVEPHTAGDPMSEQKWLNCRLADIRAELALRAHEVSEPVISRLLRAQGYRLCANVKRAAGKQHPERDLQFHYIRSQRRTHQEAQQPVISVDTKKKELVGNFKHAGRSWSRTPHVVDVHDFPNDALGRAVPYGIYDVTHNCGTVYVGQSADTATFAVDNLAHWCATELPERFAGATRLLILADSGGSNGARSRLWKQQLQTKVADPFALTVTVCHYPPGASKWNPIEHRLFSEISKTWAGVPLRSFDLVLHYLRTTTTQGGLTVRAHLVTAGYTTGVQVSDEEMAALDCRFHAICPQWNYTLSPRHPFPVTLPAEVIYL